MKITSFDKQNLQELRKKLEQVLVGPAEEFGIALKIGSITYDRGGKLCSLKLEGAACGPDGIAVSVEAEAYKLHAETFGLKPEWLNQEFVHPYNNDKRYQLLGLNVRARKNRVLVKSINDGKNYVVSEQMVIAGFEKAGRQKAMK